MFNYDPMVPMCLPSGTAPTGSHRVLGKADGWVVYATQFSLRDARAGYLVIQPLVGPMHHEIEELPVRRTPGGLVVTSHLAATFHAVSLMPRLFRAQGCLAGLLVPEDAAEADVLLLAKEVYGEADPVPSI